MVLVGLFFLVGCLFALTMFVGTDMYQQEVGQKLNRELAAHIVEEHPLLEQGRIQEAVLEDLFHTLMVINPAVEIYLLDPIGNILAFSAPPGKVKRTAINIAPIRRFLADHRLPVLGEDPKSADRDKVFSAAPILENDELRGYLYVVVGGEQYDSITSKLQGSYILTLSSWAVAAGLLFAVVTGLIVFAFMTRRLRRLTWAMGAFRQAGFSRPVALSAGSAGGGDEIDALTDTFAEMADHIIKQMERLKHRDNLRRELVANVSHDLRTPLASLQGYLETLLLKNGEFNSEEQREHIEVAVRHSKRLSKLVDELFELAKLDSRDTQPNSEPFAITELIHDVVQEFKLRTNEKDVRLETAWQGEVPFVNADVGLIERVLENLIENALRFTPRGGTVRLSLTPEPGQVLVCVADTGCGIEEHDLPHIFDRFYRSSRNGQGGQGSDGGAGLGLAMAKRILELHGSRIQARSKRDMGTVFTFPLPVAQF